MNPKPCVPGGGVDAVPDATQRVTGRGRGVVRLFVGHRLAGNQAVAGVARASHREAGWASPRAGATLGGAGRRVPRHDRRSHRRDRHVLCKRHAAGFNVQTIADLDGRLLDTGLPCPGARHDRKALGESGVAQRWAGHLRPDGPGMLADLGTAAITGTRKPRGRDLTDVQRRCNSTLNQLRAAVERSIAHLVNWQIIDTGWRGRLGDFPEVLHTVTGLGIYRTWGWKLSELRSCLPVSSTSASPLLALAIATTGDAWRQDADWADTVVPDAIWVAPGTTVVVVSGGRCFRGRRSRSAPCGPRRTRSPGPVRFPCPGGRARLRRSQCSRPAVQRAG